MTDERDGLDPRNRCPKCRSKLDAATATTGDEWRPKVGDLSVCLECRLAQVFEHGPRGLRTRPLTEAEFLTLPATAQTALINAGIIVRDYHRARRSS